jgi:hydroxymethylbilane synthase
LALAQSEQTTRRLAEGGVASDLVVIRTSGDRITNVPLARIGGKGLFIKELEEALARREIDVAIHSMKDVPAALPEEFEIAAVTARADPRDALVLRADLDGKESGGQTVVLEDEWASPTLIPREARIGTGSLRRRAQIASLRSDVTVVALRGNVDTRLRKLREGEVDALIVAAAGLERLGLSVFRRLLPETSFLPASGQGALALETRAGDGKTGRLLAHVHDPVSAAACEAERAFVRTLGGSCVAPVAAYARALSDREVVLEGLVANLTGTRMLRDREAGTLGDPRALGTRLARRLIERGALDILAEVERCMAS